VTGVVVAIDGPSGSGKSTVARGVARALGLHTLDTGAMYRAVTLAALESGTDLGDGAALARVASDTEVELEDGVARLDGRDVGALIRGPAVTAAVSQVSAHPAVRAVLVARQRAWIAAHGGRGVVEGRDIGTVVFPDAAVKVFVTASDAERARRRGHDEAAAARRVDLDALQASMADRDEADATLGRALRPEDAAPDALVIDSTDRSADDVVAEIVLRVEALAQ
jgi:cytidylate kinase